MKTLLVIHASGRITRSRTRRLTNRFIDNWQQQFPQSRIIERDLASQPPSLIDESWIAAAFASPEDRTLEMSASLAESEALISELERADIVVLGAPIYNFGIPAALKAWIDQIVRVGRTFAFEADAPEPYRPLLKSKPVIVMVSAGDGALHPGGELAHLNFLEPQLMTALGFIGLIDITFVRVGYDEYQDDRHRNSLAAAERTVDAISERLVADSAMVSAGP